MLHVVRALRIASQAKQKGIPFADVVNDLTRSLADTEALVFRDLCNDPLGGYMLRERSLRMGIDFALAGTG